MRRRQNHRDDPERQTVVNNENPDDINMQSLNNSLAEDYSEAGTLERQQSRNGSLADDSALLLRSNHKNGTKKGKKSAHSNNSRKSTRNEGNSQRSRLMLKNTQV